MASAEDVMFVLAHLSDPHLPPPAPPGLVELLGKRALGHANWRWRRASEHRPEVLDAILGDLAVQAPDHIAVTGDLVVTALPGEFAPARTFLQQIGPPERVTLVPGNHDAYVRGAMELGHRHWGDYMRADGAAHSEFPFVRRRGPVALIGLSTALPTGPFMAWGRLGDEQLGRLAKTLQSVADEGLFRIVLLHHPTDTIPGDRFRQLTDADRFRDVVRQCGTELVLHGHRHTRSLAWIDGPHAKVPVLGVPSASSAGHKLAAYNLYRIERVAGEWHCEAHVRGLISAGSGVSELGHHLLVSPRPQ
jgi:3',5'-cyclic AMP phosphodiesterase CpdA